MYISIRKKYYSIALRQWIDRPAEEIIEEHETRVSQSEATLWYNVILSALEDLRSPMEAERESAINFLSGKDGMLQEVADAINEYDAEDQMFDSALLQNPPTIKFNATVVMNLFKKLGPDGMSKLFREKLSEYTEATITDVRNVPSVPLPEAA